MSNKLQDIKISKQDGLHEMHLAIETYMANGNFKFSVLMNLHAYEFKTKLSAKQLNYYTASGIIGGVRLTSQGKRRFSFIDRIIVDLMMHLKALNYSDDDAKRAKEILQKFDYAKRYQDDGKIAYDQIDILVLMAAATLGKKDIVITWNKENDNLQAFVNTNPIEESFNISKTIRDILFNNDGKLNLDKKSEPFIYDFLYRVDELRETLNFDQLCPEKYVILKEIKGSNASSYYEFNDISRLNIEPFDVLEKKYNYIYLNHSNSLFGININYLGEVSKSHSNDEKLIKELEFLLDKIRNSLK